MKKETYFIALGAAGLILAGLFAAACLGAKPLSLQTVYQSIFYYDKSLDAMLVRDARLPRALCSVIVGGLLAMAGAMMQGITQNPLADPSILGVTQGATLAVAIASVNLSVYGIFGNTLAALFGAIISGVLVLIFSMKNTGNRSLTKLLMGGSAISTFFLSLAAIIALLGNRSQDLAFWLSGGFRTAVWKHVWLLVITGSICFILTLTLTRKINLIALGDDAAVGLGVNPFKVRLQAMIIMTVLCAVCVSVAGNIAFVGLIVPHMVRKVTGNNYIILIPLSVLCGSALLVWADIAAKMVYIPYETPIGLFSAIFGVPVFISLVRREKT